MANSPQNLLLQNLGPPVLEALQPHRVSMERGRVLARLGERVKTIWFPENCLISSVVRAPSGGGAEAGMIGYEGFGPAIASGIEHAQTELMIQLPGEAFAVDVEILQKQLEQDSFLRSLLLRYVATLQVQATQSILAFAKAKLEERLARWLLMVQDRARKPRLELTHEFMALMLGTRRAGVTVALHELEGKALVRSERGAVVIIDRKGLKELSGGFYGVTETEYRRIMQTDAFG